MKKNCEPGLFYPIDENNPMPVSSGAVAPMGGLWCPGCMLAGRGDPAPVPGKFWATTASDPIDVKVGNTAPSDGLFCPDGSDCGLVERGARAGSSGIFFTLAAPVAITTTGMTATESGMFCQKCIITSAGMTAPESGQWWGSATSDPVAVNTGDVAPGPGMFCPASATGTCDSGGAVHGARPMVAFAAISLAASTVAGFVN